MNYNLQSLTPYDGLTYTWGLDIASGNATGGVGALVQLTDHGSGTDYLPTYDGNGNLAALVDASSGDIDAAYEYTPYGELLRAEGSYADDNPFRFSTKYTDAESGMVYFGYRHYDPANGRFLNRDPIEEEGGINLYAYAGNDPVNGIDVLGLRWLCWFEHYEILDYENNLITDIDDGFLYHCELLPDNETYPDLDGDQDTGGGSRNGNADTGATTGTGDSGTSADGDATDVTNKMSETDCAELAAAIKGSLTFQNNYAARINADRAQLSAAQQRSLGQKMEDMFSYFSNGATMVVTANLIHAALPAPQIGMKVGSFIQRIDAGGARGSVLNTPTGTTVKATGIVLAAGFGVYHGVESGQAFANGETGEGIHYAGQSAGDFMSIFVPISAPVFMGANFLDARLRSYGDQIVRDELYNGLNRDIEILQTIRSTNNERVNRFFEGGCSPSLLR